MVVVSFNGNTDDCDIVRNHMEPTKPSDIKLELEVVNLARSIMLAKEGNLKQTGYSILNSADSLISKKVKIQDAEQIAHNALPFVGEVMDCLCPLFKPREIS